MKKFVPHFTIWNVSFFDKETGNVFHNVYFLFYEQAKKFFLEQEVNEEWTVSLGGEPVFLWHIKE